MLKMKGYPKKIENAGGTCIRRLEAVDDCGFSAVVQTKTENVHLLLQPQPSCQLIKQPHWLVIHYRLLLLSARKRA